MTPRRPTEALHGMGVSPGVAIGSAVCMRGPALDVYRISLPEAQVPAEIERFRASVARAQEEIQATFQRVQENLGEELAAIFDAHALFLTDRLFLDRIEERIARQCVNAEWAVYTTAEELEERFQALEGEAFRERAEDLQDVSRYLLRSLQGVSHHELSELGENVILVADDLTPSDAVRLGRQKLAGIVLERGGQTSHTAIIARSLHVPMVAAVAGVTGAVTDDDPVVVDGGAGLVLLHAGAAELHRYRGRQRELAAEESRAAATRDVPAVTADGERIELMANVDLVEEIEDVRRFGAHGIGLYRSEFLYIERSPELPSEEVQLQIYRQLLESSSPYPVIIRTYDLGGRKLAREVMATEEDNPVLGLRGIRLTLARRSIFEVQLRALFRAGLHGDLWVLLPMISSVDEIQGFREFAGEVMEKLEAEGRPFQRRYRLGVMIEVPSAALIAEHLAQEVDFFAIGTNDLIQYALAVDRNNEHVSYLYRPLHPAILRMIRLVVQAARGAGIDVSVCGEMAGEPDHAALLLGLGVRRLSVSPRRVPAIKERLRRLRGRGLEEAVEPLLDLPTAEAVEERWQRIAGERIQEVPDDVRAAN